MSSLPQDSNRRRVNLAMAVRRWLLILAVPFILFATLAAFAQWQAVWRWFVK